MDFKNAERVTDLLERIKYYESYMERLNIWSYVEIKSSKNETIMTIENQELSYYAKPCPIQSLHFDDEAKSFIFAVRKKIRTVINELKQQLKDL